MTSTPEDPFARRPEGDQQPGAPSEGWGDAPPPPPGQQQEQPQYGQPQYAQPPQGQPQYGQPQYAPQPAAGPRPGTQKNWMGITSLVLSLVGLFTGITAIGGVILGHMSLSAVKKGEADNRGLGLAGLIIGYVMIALGLLSMIAFFAFFGWFFSECGGDNPASWCTESSGSVEIQALAR